MASNCPLHPNHHATQLGTRACVEVLPVEGYPAVVYGSPASPTQTVHRDNPSPNSFLDSGRKPPKRYVSARCRAGSVCTDFLGGGGPSSPSKCLLFGSSSESGNDLDRSAGFCLVVLSAEKKSVCDSLADSPPRGDVTGWGVGNILTGRQITSRAWGGRGSSAPRRRVR